MTITINKQMTKSWVALTLAPESVAARKSRGKGCTATNAERAPRPEAATQDYEHSPLIPIAKGPVRGPRPKHEPQMEEENQYRRRLTECQLEKDGSYQGLG